MRIDWGSVKTEYEEGKEPLARLVERYGTSERTLRRRAAKGGWVRKAKARRLGKAPEEPGHNEEPPEDKGGRISKPRRLGEAPDEPDHDEEPEDKGLIQVHRTLWKDVKRRLKKGLKKKDVKSGLEELKVAKMAGEVLTNVIKGERLAWGLSDDGGGEPCNADAVTVEMDEVTASCGADEAVDRE